MVDRERPTLGQQASEGFEEGGLLGGVGGALKGAASMFLPQAGLPGQRDLGSVFSDFVEFSRLGDIGDIGAALDPDSGLDPWERLIAASPFIGVGAVGVRQGYKRLATRHQNALGRSMLPPPNESYDLTSSFEDLGGVEADPIQSRQQAAHFSQLSLEAKSPLARPALRADTWEELGVALSPGNLAGRAAQVSESARQVGAAVVSIVPDPAIYGPDPETQQFVAAKVALTKYKRAMELGILETKNGRDPTIQLWMDMVGDYRVDSIIGIAQLEAATSGIIGPDLTMATPGRLGRIWFDEVSGEPQVAIGLPDGLLPTSRVFDWETLYPIDPKEIRHRQSQIDFEAFEGVGASNLARAFMSDTAQAIADPETWYRNFNRSARALAETTGYSVHQVSGVIAAMSANAPWLPANLIGAVHVVLQTGRPDLIPGTPEYLNAFRQATVESGWEWDMYDESSTELRQQFGPTQETGFQPDFEGLMQHYADPTSVTSPEGRLPALDDTKQEKVDLILKGAVPPWLVLRGMKTNTFGWLGADPSLIDLVVTDTWNDRVFWGTLFTGTPLAFDGYTPKTQIDPDATYHDPVSGEAVSGAEILPRIDALAEEHGWTKAQVDRWKGLLTSFPTRTAQARFLAQARAHLIVRDEFDMPTGHGVQAPAWVYARTSWDGLTSRITQSMSRDELRAVAREAHLDTVSFTHVEGNPQMERTAAGMVWDVTDSLSGNLPPLRELKAAQKGIQRDASGRVKASIITLRGADGKARPFADTSTPGVAETLRHATPTGLKVGDFELYVSNKPRSVLSVLDHLEDIGGYRRADGRAAAGFVNIAFNPETATHPGMVPGDRIVVMVPKDTVGRVKGILESSYPTDYQVANAKGSVTAAARNKVTVGDVRNLESHQLAEVLKNNDWVALTAYRHDATDGQNWQNQRQLKLDIQKRGGEIIDATGLYPGQDGIVVDEPSFLVTGLTYADAFKLGQKYNQEAVATRYGMVNMDGTYHPVQEKILFGDDVHVDSHTKLSTGHKFSFEYDWDQFLPIPEDIDTLADVGINSEPMAQITVDLGGDFGGPNWHETDRILEKLSALPGAKLRLYTHSANKVPDRYRRASESVFTDMTGVTGSVIHRNGDQYARHHADVWIPEWEYHTLSEDGFGAERTRRETLDSRSIMEIDQEAGMIWFDKDLAIQVDPEANVTMGNKGSVFRSLRIDGKLVREALVDTNGPVPIILAGQAGIPAPGRTVIEFVNGQVSKIVPHLETDWGPARDALASAGLIPDGENVKVEFPTEGAPTPAPEGVNFVMVGRAPSVLRQGNATVATQPADLETTETVREVVPEIKKIRLGPDANPDLHRQAQEVVLALHGHNDRLPGAKLLGPIPQEIWKGGFGIDIMHMDDPMTDAVTAYDKTGGVGLNIRSMQTRWNRGAQLPARPGWRVTSDRHTDFEMTLIHEAGHKLEAEMGHNTRMLNQMVTRTMDEMGYAGVRLHLSRYALTDNPEFFAEAFTQVMTKGEKAHPALVKLVQDVLMIVRENVGS